MEFIEYVQKASQYCVDHPEQRVGQAYFNVLCDVRSDLSERIRTTTLDPFYRQERFQTFYEFVEANW